MPKSVDVSAEVAAVRDGADPWSTATKVCEQMKDQSPAI